jgi:hypothetical protein
MVTFENLWCRRSVLAAMGVVFAVLDVPSASQVSAW